MLSEDPEGLVVPSGSAERCSQKTLKLASWASRWTGFRSFPSRDRLFESEPLTLIIHQNQNLSSDPENQRVQLRVYSRSI
ncbi:hypothetical protein NQZ68_040272 [Dissostichus eleginoides]|nr:hypothetical protein NQZ68_040272 [Dissostichus eleginoides]